MKAKVRIAPVELWCNAHIMASTRTSEQLEKLNGLEVEIETTSMTVRTDCHDAPTKFWRLTEESARLFDEAQGYLDRDYEGYFLRVCEHMIEMD